MHDPAPLELSGPQMRSMVDAAMDRIVRHIETLPQQPASYGMHGEALARSLVEGLPEDGRPFDELIDLLFDRVVPQSFNTASPGYLAYIPGGGIFHAAVADLVANSVNRYVGVWLAAPGLVQLEANVIRWFCEIVGYPDAAGGVLTTGGSLANLIALITARRERLPEDFLAGTLYTSDQTHHSVEKSAALAGFPAANVRQIPTGDDHRMRADDLAAAVTQDRAAGLTPFMIVANGGTTNSGVVDPLGEIADLAQREGLWLHVDAAYGGFFALTSRGRAALEGLERADSITLDPHKGMFLPYGTGSLLMRDPWALRRAHSTYADYMPAMQSDHDLIDFCQTSPELSRDFRGLRVWLPVKMHGIGVFRDALDEKLDMARWAAAELRKLSDIEVLADPALSLVTFRLPCAAMPMEEANRLNRRFLDLINAQGQVYLTGTTLHERFTLRICILSFRTHLDRIQLCLDVIKRALAELVVEIPK